MCNQRCTPFGSLPGTQVVLSLHTVRFKDIEYTADMVSLYHLALTSSEAACHTNTDRSVDQAIPVLMNSMEYRHQTRIGCYYRQTEGDVAVLKEEVSATRGHWLETRQCFRHHWSTTDTPQSQFNQLTNKLTKPIGEF